MKKKKWKKMALYTITITMVMYALTGISCIRDKDYPHAMMWFAYGMANLGLLWYEFNKIKAT